MAFHFFRVCATDPARDQDVLNQFVAAHRVTAIDRHLVSSGSDSAWVFCLTVADGPGPLPASVRSDSGRSKARLDYRELLEPDAFARFARLREWRKGVATEAGQPIYSVFNNEQLAAFARADVRSLAQLREVHGVGEARVERFGQAVLEQLEALRRAPTEPAVVGGSRA